MRKSNEYKIMIGNMLVYYLQELINEGNTDPTQTIITEFMNMLDMSKKQEQYILNEIEGLDMNINDYLDAMISLLDVYKENPEKVELKDLENIQDGFKILKKQIILSKKKVSA